MLSYFKSVGKLGSTDGEAVATLHGDTHFVRTKTCFKCILNLEFRESCVLLCEIQVQCSQCEVQCTILTFK